jgi:hypothetical protein
MNRRPNVNVGGGENDFLKKIIFFLYCVENKILRNAMKTMRLVPKT